jgi:peptidoglycan hydrolase-like protein with peptidoglycan-binding domain
MSTVQDFLNVANSQIGTGENPPGSNQNKYTAWFGLVGAWCAIFQSWCFAQIGMSNIHTAWCDDFITNAKNGKWGTWIDQYGSILPGDLAIFDWDGGSSDHVAAVNRVFSNGQWESIEGNWADSVCRVTRGRENIRGFFRPFYSPSTSQPLPAPPSNAQSSSVVKTYQAQLNIFLKHQKKPLISVDGIFGPVTKNAIKDFQTFANGMYALTGSKTRLEVDGVYGPKTKPVLDWWTNVFSNPKPKRLPVPSGTPLLKECVPSSDRVRQLQTALNRVMNSGLVVDGEYGPKTEMAVAAYQRHKSLIPDGVYGPMTSKALSGETAL